MVLLAFLVSLSGCNTVEEEDAPGALEEIFSSTLGPEHLAVVVNDNDPLSQQIAAYYMDKRHIPAENMIHVQFKPGNKVMRPEDFRPMKMSVDAQTHKNIQA